MGVLLAKQYGGEVVSVDSMQIYRGMTIGSAAPTAEEMEGVPHHMVAVADPAESWSVARFTREADRRVQDILARGKLPVLVGGTGLYLDALIDGRTFAAGQSGGAVRRSWRSGWPRRGSSPSSRSCGRRTRRPPPGCIPGMRSGSSGPWRSGGRPDGPSPSTTGRPSASRSGTTPCTSA